MCSRLSPVKVKVTAGRLPGGRGERNNAIYTIDAVSGTVARFVPEDGRRARIREVAPIARRPTSGTSASEAPYSSSALGRRGRQPVDRFHAKGYAVGWQRGLI